jgi:hypothetical protein
MEPHRTADVQDALVAYVVEALNAAGVRPFSTHPTTVVVITHSAVAPQATGLSWDPDADEWRVNPRSVGSVEVLDSPKDRTR